LKSFGNSRYNNNSNNNNYSFLGAIKLLGSFDNNKNNHSIYSRQASDSNVREGKGANPEIRRRKKCCIYPNCRKSGCNMVDAEVNDEDKGKDRHL
jgi:hypothetical protein